MIIFIILVFVNFETYSLQTISYPSLQEEIDLTKMPILFRLLPRTQKYLYPSNDTFQIKIQRIRQIDMGDQPNEFEVTELTTSKCSEIKDRPLLQKYYGRYNLEEFECISSNQDLTIKGPVQDRTCEYTSLRISVKKVNETIDAKTEEEQPEPNPEEAEEQKDVELEIKDEEAGKN